MRENRTIKSKEKVALELTEDEQHSEFLTELLDGYKRWTAIGNKEFASAYRVLLNSFTAEEPKSE